MSQSAPKPDSDGGNDSRLVDHHVKRLPQRITWRKRLRTISAKIKIIAVFLVAIVAATATFLANLEQIQDYFRPEPAPPSVPAITVKLSNSAREEIGVVARSDFFLWLPGSDARYAIGKYEFHTLEGNVPDDGQITVKPGATVTVYAQILNQELYGRLLEKAEYDINLHVRRANGGLTFTENLPFTKEAIGKYYVTADVGID